jgi:NAD(P)-dependent dehydrogenase (short-subunit alcohol dehydrogenase family)
MPKLDGKIALITGGASGIGRVTALLLAREGAAVALADLEESAAQAAARKIREKGAKAIAIACDVSRAVDCRQAVERTVEELGGLHILFNNAGIIRRADAVDTTEEEWDRVMAVNVKSVFLMSKYAVPFMARGGGGVIINTGSGWGLSGGRKALSYCASKGAVVNMTRAMAIDHGAQNIRVNCVCPGDTDTAMLRGEARQMNAAEDRFLREAADRPLRRIGKPADIAEAVLYLASEAASFVTGTTLVVDGGGLAG